MRYRKLHPVVEEHPREIDIRVLTKAGAFTAPHGMRFPFQHLEASRDHVRVFRVGNKSRQSPQIIPVTWRRMTFGLKPFFVCSRCQKRRVFLYFDGLQAYCRVCADLWFWCQRKYRRTRLLHRSHKLRGRLGDETGKLGDKYPLRRKWYTHRRYRIAIAKLKTIERQYLHIVANDRRRLDRERDEYGRYLPREPSIGTDDLGA